MREATFLVLALVLASAATPALAQAEECEAERWLALDGHGDVDCVHSDGEVVAAGVTDLDVPRPVLRLAVAREGEVAHRAEVPLRDVYPDPAANLATVAGDLSVRVAALDGGLLRISLLFGDGEDERHVRELAMIVRREASGRWTSLYVGWASSWASSRDACTHSRHVRLRVAGRRVYERARTRHRFYATEDYDTARARAVGRRLCLAGTSAERSRARHSIRERALLPPARASSDWLEAFDEAAAVHGEPPAR